MTATPVAVLRTPAAVSVIVPSWSTPSVAPGTRCRCISSVRRSCQAAASSEPEGAERETGVGIRSSVRTVTSKPSPSLRAGVVGTGFIGVVHVEALRRLGVEVAGVVGSSPERARAKATRARLRRARRAARRPAVDVVHLTTPNHLHYPQVKQALEAGKHVVCEKPLAMTVGGVRRAARARRGERARPLHELQHPLLPAGPGGARARGGGRARRRAGTSHGGYLQDWLLLPDRLELAARARAGRRRCARSATSARTGSTSRSSSPAADRRGLSPTSRRRSRCGAARSARSRRSPRAADVERVDVADGDRGPRATSSCASTAARAARASSRRSARAARTRSASRSTARRRRSPGTASGPRSCGSATATAPNELAAARTRRCWTQPARPRRRRLPGRACRGLRRHVPRAVPRRLPRGRRGRSPATTTRPSATATSRTSSARRSRVQHDEATMGGGDPVKLGLLTAAFARPVARRGGRLGGRRTASRCSRSRAGRAAGGERRRYAGVSHIDVDALDVDAVHATLDRHGLEISSLAYYPNNLHPDDARARGGRTGTCAR